jgi:hypothetical protein
MKFLLNVGAEKAGTSWLYNYFDNHPQFHSIGKELNALQRDDLVPTTDLNIPTIFKKDIKQYFQYFSRLNKVSGDFTHYEGSTENIFRLIKDGFMQYDIEVVPLYIMRDPAERAWSAWNMLSGGSVQMAPAAKFVMDNILSCKYKETIEALDCVFPKPLYFFYEEFFTQENINIICDKLDINRLPADFSIINKGSYTQIPSEDFLEIFGTTLKNKQAVKFISERFDNIPWNVEYYT